MNRVVNKGLQQVTNFIEKLYSSGDLPATEKAKRQSLMGHVSSFFSRMSVFQPNGQTQTVIPATERKKSEEQEKEEYAGIKEQ